MKERPILFQGAMVRAILDGSKTQTRRKVKWRRCAPGLNTSFTGLSVFKYPMGWVLESPGNIATEWRCHPTPCPLGQPGDRLWVRETFQPLLADDADWREANWLTGAGYAVKYVATDGARSYLDMDDNIRHACKPSIHMPRWASRITLEITDVRIERLTRCSDADALAEGITGPHGVGYSAFRNPDDSKPRYSSATTAFEALWEQINGAGSWAANPWVWVIGFRRLNQ